MSELKESGRMKDLEVECCRFADGTLSLSEGDEEVGDAVVSMVDRCVETEVSVSPDDARKVRDWWIKFCEKFDGR